MQLEAEESNKAAIAAKEEAKLKEKALEQQVVEFQKRKEAREAEVIA